MEECSASYICPMTQFCRDNGRAGNQQEDACGNDDTVLPHEIGAVCAVLLHREGGGIHHPDTPLGVHSSAVMADELYSRFLADLDLYWETSLQGPELKENFRRRCRLANQKVGTGRVRVNSGKMPQGTVLQLPGIGHPPHLGLS